MVGHRARPRHADRPLPADGPRAGPVRLARPAETDSGVRGHPAHPSTPVRRDGRRRHRSAGRPDLPARSRSRTHRGGPVMTLLAEKPQTPKAKPASVRGGLLDPQQLWKSLPDAVVKLDPRTLWRNPVMFIVEVGAVFTTVLSIVEDFSQ